MLLVELWIFEMYISESSSTAIKTNAPAWRVDCESYLSNWLCIIVISCTPFSTTDVRTCSIAQHKLRRRSLAGVFNPISFHRTAVHRKRVWAFIVRGSQFPNEIDSDLMALGRRGRR